MGRQWEAKMELKKRGRFETKTQTTAYPVVYFTEGDTARCAHRKKTTAENETRQEKRQRYVPYVFRSPVLLDGTVSAGQGAIGAQEAEVAILKLTLTA